MKEEEDSLPHQSTTLANTVAAHCKYFGWCLLHPRDPEVQPYVVLFFGFLSTIIAYSDRANISVAIIPMVGASASFLLLSHTHPQNTVYFLR